MVLSLGMNEAGGVILNTNRLGYVGLLLRTTTYLK